MNQKLVHITNQSLLRYAYVYTMTAFTVSTISYRNQDKRSYIMIGYAAGMQRG